MGMAGTAAKASVAPAPAAKGKVTETKDAAAPRALAPGAGVQSTAPRVAPRSIGSAAVHQPARSAVAAKPARSGTVASSGQKATSRRSLPADDPLAPQRTRWLADAVGGVAKLATMLGVSTSQPSRWATGEERPGVIVAPLLIDLEHVLARVRLVWSDPTATTWMSSANAHLDGARPIDVLALHGPGPVLEALDAGAWGGAV